MQRECPLCKHQRGAIVRTANGPMCTRCARVERDWDINLRRSRNEYRHVPRLAKGDVPWGNEYVA